MNENKTEEEAAGLTKEVRGGWVRVTVDPRRPIRGA